MKKVEAISSFEKLKLLADVKTHGKQYPIKANAMSKGRSNGVCSLRI